MAAGDVFHQARVVDPATVHSAMVDNVLHSTTFLDPARGIETTGITTHCFAGSDSPASCPAPAPTEHTTRMALSPWVSVKWGVSAVVVPPRSALAAPHAHPAYADPAGGQGGGGGGGGGGVAGMTGDDDDLAAIVASAGDGAGGSGAGNQAWLEWMRQRAGEWMPGQAPQATGQGGGQV